MFKKVGKIGKIISLIFLINIVLFSIQPVSALKEKSHKKIEDSVNQNQKNQETKTQNSSSTTQSDSQHSQQQQSQQQSSSTGKPSGTASSSKPQSSETTSKVKDNCVSPASLTGIREKLGLGVDLLYLDTKDNLLEFSCNDRTLSLDGLNQIPDGVNAQLLLQLNQQQKTLIAQNTQQYENFKLSTFNTNLDNSKCPEYDYKLKVVAGELNPNNKQVESQLNSKEWVYQIMSTKFKTYRADIMNYQKVKLSPAFEQALEVLPSDYNEKIYIEFLQKFGTHYREGIILGGLISLVGYTSTSYTNANDLQDMGSNFDNYFAQQLLNENLSINHIPNQLLNPNPDSSYTQFSNFNPLHIGGGTHAPSSLQGWIETLQDQPYVVEQRLVNITSLITSDLLSGNSKLKNIIPTLKGNINQGLKDYLIKSSGCTDSKAINYDPHARIADGSCYYSVYYGSYQTATGNCNKDFSDRYVLLNPVTNDLSCPLGSAAKQVAIYTYDGCDLKQFFCLRNGVPTEKEDLRQSLQICQARSLTNVFYSNSQQQQYLCNDKEQSLKFYLKFDQKKVIYTCTQQFCFQKESTGTESFADKHIGTCSSYNVHQSQETQETVCQGSCLIQYGLVKLADDCDLRQFICVQNQFDIQCVNNEY